MPEERDRLRLEYYHQGLGQSRQEDLEQREEFAEPGTASHALRERLLEVPQAKEG